MNRTKYPHNIGNLYMSRDTLQHFKNPLKRVEPSGFHFSPVSLLTADLMDIFEYVNDDLTGVDQICPLDSKAGWNADIDIYRAARFCNNLRHLRKKARTTFSVEDMHLIAKASGRLQKPIGASGADLDWALLVCPDLFLHLRTHFTKSTGPKLKAFLACELEIGDGAIKCVKLEGVQNGGQNGDQDVEKPAAGDSDNAKGSPKEFSIDSKYDVPLFADVKFTGTHVLAAFPDVCLTFYWMEKRWVTDVHMDTGTIPPMVMMLWVTYLIDYFTPSKMTIFLLSPLRQKS